MQQMAANGIISPITLAQYGYPQVFILSLEQIILLPLFHPYPYFTFTPISPWPGRSDADFTLTLNSTSFYPILIIFLDDGRYATRYCLAAWYDDRARPDKWNNVESHAERDDAPG